MKVITYTLIAENPVYNETEQDVFARNSQNATLLTTSFITSGRLGTWKNLEGKGKESSAPLMWGVAVRAWYMLFALLSLQVPACHIVRTCTNFLGRRGQRKKACATITMTQNTPLLRGLYERRQQQHSMTEQATTGICWPYFNAREKSKQPHGWWKLLCDGRPRDRCYTTWRMVNPPSKPKIALLIIWRTNWKGLLSIA